MQQTVLRDTTGKKQSNFKEIQLHDLSKRDATPFALFTCTQHTHI